jgi:hypothetical protein
MLTLALQQQVVLYRRTAWFQHSGVIPTLRTPNCAQEQLSVMFRQCLPALFRLLGELVDHGFTNVIETVNPQRKLGLTLITHQFIHLSNQLALFFPHFKTMRQTALELHFSGIVNRTERQISTYP